MKNISVATKISLLIFFVVSVSVIAQTKFVKYVDPFIGTDGHGHTYPGATLPFGMVQLSPDTDITGWDWCSGYHYSDNSIIGFSHTHLSGTGCADYGDILFMPTVGELKTIPGSKSVPGSGYRSSFDHKNEIVEAGYYSVRLDDYKIKVELTATKRTGIHKYTFPKSDQSNIIIDLVHGIEDQINGAELNIIDSKTISGFRRSSGWAKNHCVYFYAEFSKPFQTFGVVENGNVLIGKKYSTQKNLKAFVKYSTTNNEAILVKVGISHTSIEGAKRNLKAEAESLNFDVAKRNAQNEWEKELSKISVESKDERQMNIFYTSLYHSLLNPNTFSDVNGAYIGMDNKIHSLKNRDMFSVFSLWDTFRADHPLFTIIDKKKASDMVNALITKFDESGLLPIWELASNETGTMIGYHSIPVIADAYFKGIRDYDVEKAFAAMKISAMQNHHGLDSYKEMGYISSDLENESVSKTLEYAYDDWCIAMMAKDLGKMDDYKIFIERSKYYSNLFDPSTSLMRPKKNGKWFEPFDPYSVSGNYTEANSWQYSFFVPHDVNGLIHLMGGNEKFISKLDQLFTTDPKLTGRVQSDITGLIGQYAHGNEPSHHMAYLYNYAGAPWKTQQKVHEIVTTLYSEKADGLCGNEDCGQMSAWYVMSSLGFYPVCPGDEKYIFGTPSFGKITIKTGEKNKFMVIANNISENNFYIQSAKLNGKDYPFSYIKHSDLVKGGKLVFEMGPNPSNWGTEIKNCPTSEVDNKFITTPYLISGERVFRDSIAVAIASSNTNAKIFFTTDNSNPDMNSQEYSQPLTINNTATIKTVCYQDGLFSKIVTANFNNIPDGRSIKLNSVYNHSYAGGGALGLIDGIIGTINFHTDDWLGFEGVDFDAVVDLGKAQKISSIGVSFLQNTGSWIFFPDSIVCSISSDGINYSQVFITTNKITDNNRSEELKTFEKSFEKIDARYIHVYAKNVGVCPPWHHGSGGKAWLFIDEILIK